MLLAIPRLDLDGTDLRWPDGSAGVLRQEYFLHADRVPADGETSFVLLVAVARPGHDPIAGSLRFTTDYLRALGGGTDVEKSRATASDVAPRLVERPLSNGFELLL